MRWFSLIIAYALFASSCARRVPRPLDLPQIMLWAWQRPEDLRFIDTRTTGVAYLAATARISPNGSTKLEPRLQPLKVTPGTALVAVVRIESAPRHSAVDAVPISESVREMSRAPGIRAVQIDFDARESERGFYSSLLQALDARLSLPVSVTALASWCEGDHWLNASDIGEAVPMFFRMGAGETRNMAVSDRVCSSSIGLATDEPWPMHRPPAVKRIYLFHPRAWDRDAYVDALKKIEEWR